MMTKWCAILVFGSARLLLIVLQSSESSGEDESYFADPTSGESIRAPRLADEQGYVIRTSVLEEGTRPEYIIPVGSADGVWGMIKRIGRFRGEGWFALWKGILISLLIATHINTVY